MHESRRLKPECHVRDAGLPCTAAARSAIDAAAWQPWPRFACAMLAAVVQQRLCTVNDLDQALRYVGRVRHKAHVREALRDIPGGAEALSEIDLIRLCRRFGGWSHTARSGGRIETVGDATSTRSGTPGRPGRGSRGRWRHHLDVENWQADMRRERAVVITGRRVLRATRSRFALEASRRLPRTSRPRRPPELSETQ